MRQTPDQLGSLAAKCLTHICLSKLRGVRAEFAKVRHRFYLTISIQV
jgi:hypothetical protein